MRYTLKILLLLMICNLAFAAPQTKDLKSFINKMVVKHKFSRDKLNKLFAEAKFQKKIVGY